MALEKGTEEWMFWSDFFQFCKKYWNVESRNEYWESLIRESEELNSKYNTLFSRKFIIAFLSMQSEIYKNMNR